MRASYRPPPLDRQASGEAAPPRLPLYFCGTTRNLCRDAGQVIPEAGHALDAVRCPRCARPLQLRAGPTVCPECRGRYPRLGEIPVLLSDPDAYLAACRTQLT